MNPHRIAALLGLLALLSTPAAAQPSPRADAAGRTQSPPAAHLVHRSKLGDTLALLAAEYYGSRRYAVFLAAENQLDPALQPLEAPLKPNLRLRIPVPRRVVTGAGETLAEVAAAHLGDARRARFLFEFNAEAPPEQRLALSASGPQTAGLIIELPLELHHRVQAGETLAMLARRYYGAANGNKVEFLRAYNFLGDEALAPDSELVVPIRRIAMQPSRVPPLDAASRARADKHEQMSERARAALTRARVAWYAGNYAAVRGALQPLELDYVAAAEAVEIGVLLAGAHVAFDERDKAVAVLAQVLPRAPETVLDPYQVSPKVRAAWQQARDALEAPR
ncbi:LysM peptidoglycan-binding domain-containing protein [Haliangium ochraceum]|uniref:Peptidoglycan-binding lysin domain protein n=1 Tax=Haliangium ochraceum (strain DSM 14365 / JCM 11303 / SMP-2) TaxID=502025 RepID=D0LGR8_HALO1|nr:LysM peptidoglycan-binding domain-containing protein [Haliangium ochraceum]ACY14640.1 Peptidoglycan-binding lysin domain protein [Haliangium ochraceum DSM 14365]